MHSDPSREIRYPDLIEANLKSSTDRLIDADEVLVKGIGIDPSKARQIGLCTTLANSRTRMRPDTHNTEVSKDHSSKGIKIDIKVSDRMLLGVHDSLKDTRPR